MAGGRGLRLHPLTEHTPKPMLLVGQKPMLQVIVEGYVAQGFTDITLAVYYRHDIIERHFGDGSAFGCKIDYLHEREPMGTAGALSLLPPQDKPIIVQNADVLTAVDYKNLIAFHNNYDSAATICLTLYQHQVPYGVMDIEGGFVARMREKPIESWLINAGIYVLSPALVASIPRAYCDMNDALTAAPGFVRHYQLTEPWRDVGRFEDLAAANGG